ncbi:MAG: NAD-dependent epimerase/dehydratase family protein [Candidatus Limnocylindrales bacterium]|jgi:UDP-glucose 4-epimerase
MRVLVTGGAGFVGSHLVDAHVARGDDVVVVDDLSTGRMENIAAHVAGGRIRFHQGKAEDSAVLGPAFEGVDLVYHLAAAVGVFQILQYPLASIRTNLEASSAVFERAAARSVRTVFTSTSEVYGKNVSDALKEDDDTIYGPTKVRRWLYAVSKATDEFLALAYHQELGLPVTVVRLFNTTGPRQTGAYGMVVPRFVRQAIEGQPLTVYGDGGQLRCFTNVHDVVAALMALAATPAAIGEVVNVGNPREISIRDLASLVCKIVGSNSPVQLIDYESAYGEGFEDMRRRVPDVSRLRSLIGFVPTTPLEETIEGIARDFTPERHPLP